MKYIKLFENFEGDNKQKELTDELAASLGVNFDAFAETSKITAMSPEEIQKWFDAELDKEEPNMPVIEELVRLGYKFDLPKEKNLFYAAQHNKVGLAKYLLDRGADIEASNYEESTSLHWAAMYDSRAVAELLLDRGAKIEARNNYQRTPLHFAALEDSRAVAELLLDRGAKIEARDKYQRTPLHRAAEYDKQDIAELLLDRGADIEARDGHYKRTPLHLVAEEGSRAVAELLLDRGAKIEARDGNQRTPWDLANEEMQEALPQLNPNYKGKR